MTNWLMKYILRAKTNFQEWYSPKLVIILLVLFIIITCVLYYAFGNLTDAFIAISPIFCLMILSILTKEKSNIILADLILIAIGMFIIYSVFDDFIKTLKITVGLFIIRIFSESLMEDLGNPHIKVLRKVHNMLSKRVKKENNQHIEE